VNRTFSILMLEHEKGRMLYVRIKGDEDGVTYGCYNLGPHPRWHDRPTRNSIRATTWRSCKRPRARSTS